MPTLCQQHVRMYTSNESIWYHFCSFFVTSYPNAGRFHQRLFQVSTEAEHGWKSCQTCWHLDQSCFLCFFLYGLSDSEFFIVLPFYWYGLLWWMIFGILIHVGIQGNVWSFEWKPAICWHVVQFFSRMSWSTYLPPLFFLSFSFSHLKPNRTKRHVDTTVWHRWLNLL